MEVLGSSGADTELLPVFSEESAQFPAGEVDLIAVKGAGVGAPGETDIDPSHHSAAQGLPVLRR